MNRFQRDPTVAWIKHTDLAMLMVFYFGLLGFFSLWMYHRGLDLDGFLQNVESVSKAEPFWARIFGIGTFVVGAVKLFRFWIWADEKLTERYGP